MTTVVGVHQFILAAKCPDYRCACGRTWIRRGKRGAASDTGGLRHRQADGWFHCVCGDRQFRWSTKPA